MLSILIIIGTKDTSLIFDEISFRILFVFRHPKSIPSNAFLLPFESTLWYAIVGLVLFSACIVWNIFSVENHKKVRKSMEVEGPANEDSYSNSILMVFGFIVQQSEAIKSYLQDLNKTFHFTQAISEIFLLHRLEY